MLMYNQFVRDMQNFLTVLASAFPQSPISNDVTKCILRTDQGDTNLYMQHRS